MKRIACLSTICLALAALIFTMSCRDKKEKEVFEKPAAERIQQSINSLREKLKSHAPGWKLAYKPDKAKTGHYQFLFRFVNDTEAEIASDFSSDDLTLKKSEYSVLYGSTTKLSFSTAGPLHKLSDSEFSPIPGSPGSGLKGDFEFLYYGENEQGDLVFRTNRTNETLLFKKASDNSLKDIESSYANLAKLARRKSVYRALFESKDGTTIKSSFSFPYNARVIKIRGVTERSGKPVLDAGYLTGYGLMPEGIYLDSVKRKSGEFLKNVQLKYNENQKRFETVLSDGTLLAIGDSNAPIIPASGQKDFLDPTLTSGLTFWYKDEDLEEGLTTLSFDAIVEELIPLGFNAYFGLVVQDTNRDLADYILLFGTASVSNGAVRALLTYEDKGDRLVIKRTGEYTDEDSSIKPANANTAQFKEFMDFLTDPQGFYVENLGKITAFENQIFTFTSVRDPSIRFALYHSP